MRHRYKQQFFWIVAAGIGLLTGCDYQRNYDSKQQVTDIKITLETTQENKKEKRTDFSRGDLFTMFEEMNNETVVDFQYGDYNKDGTHEAFVVTNTDGCKLWYMHGADCELLLENFTEQDVVSEDVISFQTKDYFLLQRVVDGKQNTLVYTIDNKDKVLEPIISGEGWLKTDTSKNMTLWVYADESSEGYSEYYLYYSPDEGFKEYGGIPIVEEQFLEFTGAEEILAQIRSLYGEYEPEVSYLYRSNGYINVNWSYYENGQIQYRHTTLQYDNQKITLVGELENEGREEIAHILEIATFPTAFKHPDNRISE